MLPVIIARYTVTSWIRVPLPIRLTILLHAMALGSSSTYTVQQSSRWPFITLRDHPQRTAVLSLSLSLSRPLFYISQNVCAVSLCTRWRNNSGPLEVGRWVRKLQRALSERAGFAGCEEAQLSDKDRSTSYVESCKLRTAVRKIAFEITYVRRMTLQVAQGHWKWRDSTGHVTFGS